MCNQWDFHVVLPKDYIWLKYIQRILTWQHQTLKSEHLSKLSFSFCATSIQLPWAYELEAIFSYTMIPSVLPQDLTSFRAQRGWCLLNKLFSGPSCSPWWVGLCLIHHRLFCSTLLWRRNSWFYHRLLYGIWILPQHEWMHFHNASVKWGGACSKLCRTTPIDSSGIFVNQITGVSTWALEAGGRLLSSAGGFCSLSPKASNFQIKWRL